MYGLPVVSQARRVASGTSPVRSDTTIKQSITRSLSAWLCYVNEPLLTADCRPITDGPLSPEKRPISHLAHRMNERLFTALAARKRPGRFPPFPPVYVPRSQSTSLVPVMWRNASSRHVSNITCICCEAWLLSLGPLTFIGGDLRKRLVTVHGTPATSKLTSTSGVTFLSNGWYERVS